MSRICLDGTQLAGLFNAYGALINGICIFPNGDTLQGIFDDDGVLTEGGRYYINGQIHWARKGDRYINGTIFNLK